MKQKIVIGVIFLIAFIFPNFVYAEAIDDYEVEVVVNAAGIIRISERILYNFGDLKRHGIVRTILYSKLNDKADRYILDISDVSVVDERNNPYALTTTDSDYKLSLRIGDPNKQIIGKHTYIISYTVKGGITYFSDHDELYWNAIGEDWQVPIANAKVQVKLPEKAIGENVHLSCYTGTYKSKEQFCSYVYLNNIVAFVSNEEVKPGEGLTVVVGFPKNIVAVLEPKLHKSFFKTVFGKIFIALLGLIGIFWYIVFPFVLIRRWHVYGRDPKPPMGVASAWFDAPKTASGRRLTPAETGALVDEHVNVRDITAMIFDLARRGFLKIVEKNKGDFYLIKGKEESYDNLENFEKTLLNGLFKYNILLRVKDAHLAPTIEVVKDALYEHLVREGMFPENPKKVRDTYYILSVVAFFTANIFLSVVAIFFGRNMPRKTILGAQTSAIGKSLKNFLSSQKRQFKFQADKQIMFEKMLPYAIAFGVERIWAERFKHISLKQPEWYEGYGGEVFNSVAFVHSLDASLSKILVTTIAYSTSGFSSGFSGRGGFSGGGGGGGGGGSW